MINTTQSFYDNSIYKFRSTKSEITVDIYDNTVKSDVSSLNVNANRFYVASQLYDDDYYDIRYATGEYNEFKLDGSMTLMPNNTSGVDLGWWTVLGNSTGEFATNPQLTINLNNNHSSIGLTFYYDEFSKPLKSTCYWYNGSTLLDSMELQTTENIQVFEKSVTGYNKIILEINKVNPYAYSKLAEINFGITRTFAGSILQGAKVVEKCSIMSNTISPNELTFNIIDYDNTYNVFNPTNLYTFFKFGQKCYAKSSILNRSTGTYEKISMGIYYIDTVEIAKGILKIKSYGLLNILNSQTFYSPFYSNVTAEDIVDDILDGYDYYVHPNVKDIVLSGYIPIGSKKEALKYVAIACGAVIKEGRDGKIYIYQATPEFSTNQIVAEDTVYEQYGMANLLTANDSIIPRVQIPKSYIFTISREQRLSDLETSLIGFYNQCDVTYITYTDGNTEEIFNDTVTANEDGIAIIKYNSAVVITSVTVSGAAYTNYADCTILNGTPLTQYSVVINGKKKSEEKHVASSYISTVNAYDEAKLTMALDSCNKLITNQARAKACADWYLTSLQKRKDVKFDWWSIATTEASDFVNIVTSFDETTQIQINEIEYDLYDLTATVKGVI